jgi:type II secretion system protein I
MSRGFTLLEVLVAMAILSLAIVTLMQLSSQGLRLLRLSEDYQQAVLLADRIARDTDVTEERADAGQEGPFRWERRIALVTVPEELASGAGPRPHLYALSIAVRWGSSRTLELASLRTAPVVPGAPVSQSGSR